ncbi:unnamed protein product [Cunninghamella blakesleeana]
MNNRNVKACPRLVEYDCYIYDKRSIPEPTAQWTSPIVWNESTLDNATIVIEETFLDHLVSQENLARFTNSFLSFLYLRLIDLEIYDQIQVELPY